MCKWHLDAINQKKIRIDFVCVTKDSIHVTKRKRKINEKFRNKYMQPNN